MASRLVYYCTPDNFDVLQKASDAIGPVNGSEVDGIMLYLNPIQLTIY